MSTVTKQDKKESEYATKNKSMLCLHLDSLAQTNGTVEINNELVIQTMILKSIRIHFETGRANVAANQALFLTLSSFGPGHITNNLGFSGIPIMHDATVDDSTFYPDIKVSLGKKMPKKIVWRLVNAAGQEISANQVTFVQVMFELELV